MKRSPYDSNSIAVQSFFHLFQPDDNVEEDAKKAAKNVRKQKRKYQHDAKDMAAYKSWSILRLYLHDVIESNWFSASILFAIFINTVLITLQTTRDSEVTAGWYFSVCDNLLLGIYIVELILKMFVWRWKLFKVGWNIFDFVIVGLSVGETTFILFMGSLGGFDPTIFRLLRVFRALRAIRALRVLRTISFLSSLQIIVTTLLRSIPAWGSISMILFLILYIFAIIGVTVYKDIHPQRFGGIWIALLSLFQLITLDDWFEMYDEVKHVDRSFILYLIVFIVVETFIFINLFVAVIVNNLEQLQLQQIEKMKQAKHAEKQKALKMHALKVRSTSMTTVHPKLATRKVESYYEGTGADVREVHMMGDFFMLLASLEYNMDYWQHEQKLLDDLVDVMMVLDENEE
eukprot:101960_1